MRFPAHLELVRHGVGLVPEPGGGQAGGAILISRINPSQPLRSCPCQERSRTCDHLKRLGEEVRAIHGLLAGRAFEDTITGHVWLRLARLVAGDAPLACVATRVVQVELDEGPGLRFTSPSGEPLALWQGPTAAAVRLVERLGKAPREGSAAAPYRDRAGLLERLAAFQESEAERQMARLGSKTRRKTWEESFWYRLAYHFIREHDSGGSFHPAVDRESGRFSLAFRVDDKPLLRLFVPRDRVRAALRLLAEEFPEQEDLALHPIPLRTLFHVRRETELDLAVRPMIRALQADGEERFFAREDLARFTYGDLVYVPELGVLAELERAGEERRFRTPKTVRLARSQVAAFLDAHREALEGGDLLLGDGLTTLRVRREVDEVVVRSRAGAKGRPGGDPRPTLSDLAFRFGGREIAVDRLLAARAADQPFLEVEDGWIDLQGDDLRPLARFAAADGELAPRELLGLVASTGRPVTVLGARGPSARVRRLLELRPARPLAGDDGGLASALRPYQRLGADWLRFLWETRLGGLLCDEMGLGKTHQTMALFASLRRQDGVAAPFLVVCPTTVLPHWRAKLQAHAPELGFALHHGGARDLAAAVESGLVLTSYGVLRRDAEALARVPFAVAVFDEAQGLKNRETASYAAAESLAAEVKIGLTGTPVENSPADLATLFDLVLPGYLGGVESPGELRRRVSPFVLRRRKQAVLTELPDKIEDLRTCVLSDDQRALYEQAMAERARPLVEELADRARPVPYLHVFALLDYLKRLCDHPALVLGDLGAAETRRSGKWDLVRELLAECLDAELKVVVFSQYLGMIELLDRHLTEAGVGFATLTGRTRDRGEVVDRFNGDPGCRVFLGSLKAGGTGIDLVGGSVVIHVDRWWNAAREDQATDRVHRIGQRRAVQVFKLVTENTIEERIAELIDAKRALLDDLVAEDDPALAKVLSREDLLRLLGAPSAS